MAGPVPRIAVALIADNAFARPSAVTGAGRSIIGTSRAGRFSFKADELETAMLNRAAAAKKQPLRFEAERHARPSVPRLRGAGGWPFEALGAALAADNHGRERVRLTIVK